MRSCYLVILLLIFISCNENRKGQPLTKNDSTATKTDSPSSVAPTPDAEITEYPLPGTNQNDTPDYLRSLNSVPPISFLTQADTSISIQDPNKTDNVLTTLFPGKLYPSSYTVAWKAKPTAKNKRIQNSFEELSYLFPGEGACETRFEDTFYYETGNNKYFAFFFSTRGFDGEESFLRVGRTACAVFGAAIFRKNADKWHLTGYNPSAGCFGMFGSPAKPKKIKLNDTLLGFYIKNEFGGPGGPYEADTYIFRLDSTISKVLTAYKTHRMYQKYTWWISEITSDSEAKLISFNTNGYINSNALGDGYDAESLEPPLRKLADGNNYKFTRKKIYTADSAGRYHLTTDKFNYKKVPLDTVNGNLME